MLNANEALRRYNEITSKLQAFNDEIIGRTPTQEELDQEELLVMSWRNRAEIMANFEAGTPAIDKALKDIAKRAAGCELGQRVPIEFRVAN